MGKGDKRTAYFETPAYSGFLSMRIGEAFESATGRLGKNGPHAEERPARTRLETRTACAAALLALGVLAPLPASAQILDRSMTAPQPFGVLLGDVFTLKTRVDVARPFKLDPSALPKPGPVTYWLDLRSVSSTEAKGPNGATRYEISAEYQTFYAPLEAIEQTVPPMKLVMTDGQGKRVEASGASWTFITSPLRPIVATAGGGSAYGLRPDAAPRRPSLRSAEIGAAAAGGAALLALVWLAFARAWPPFHQRPSRPFAAAARTVAKAAGDGEQGWRTAALSLHRAFDAAAGKRLLGEDLPAFLVDRPAFSRLETSIRQFFHASRRAFFGRSATPSEMPASELVSLSRSLAAAERIS
jgi:mxaA protein